MSLKSHSHFVSFRLNNIRISFRRTDALLEDSSCEVAAIDCVEPTESVVTPLSTTTSLSVTSANQKKNGTGNGKGTCSELCAIIGF